MNGNSTEARRAAMTPERKAKLKAATAAYYAQFPLEMRFWSKVDVRGLDDCWEWTASLDGRGYGQFWYEGTLWKSYRVVLALLGITPPKRSEGKCVDHKCRNPKCINPVHLRIVTDKVNGTENNVSLFAANANKKFCKHGHDILSPGNYALLACKGPKGSPMVTRSCLTCYPQNWSSPKRIFITA